MRDELTDSLTQLIEFIRGGIDGLKLYLFDHPLEVLVVVFALFIILVLFYYLPRLLAALYKDLMQLLRILLKWVVFAVILSFVIWIVASFPTTCHMINDSLGTQLSCGRISNNANF